MIEVLNWFAEHKDFSLGLALFVISCIWLVKS